MAIFKRGKSRSLAHKAREVLWPSMGWQRTVNYYRHRMFRGGDSTYKITAGLAVGVAISFTPLLGTQIFQAIVVAWLLRASMLASVIGTIAGNPWTFPAIFWAIYTLGIWVCGLFGLEDFVALPPDETYLEDSAWYFINYLFDHPVKLLLPLLVGGYLAALLVWPLAYLLLYYPVRTWRRAYHSQKLRRAYKKGLKTGKSAKGTDGR